MAKWEEENLNHGSSEEYARKWQSRGPAHPSSRSGRRSDRYSYGNGHGHGNVHRGAMSGTGTGTGAASDAIEVAYSPADVNMATGVDINPQLGRRRSRSRSRSPTLSSPRETGAFYTPTSSPENYQKEKMNMNRGAQAKNEQSKKRFPILNFGSINSTPSDELSLHNNTYRNQYERTKFDSQTSSSSNGYGNGNDITSPNVNQGTRKASGTTNPFASMSRSGSSEKEYSAKTKTKSRTQSKSKSTNPFNSMSFSSSNSSSPGNSPEKGYRNPFGSRSASASPKDSNQNQQNQMGMDVRKIEKIKTNPFNSRSGSGSRSPSPSPRRERIRNNNYHPTNNPFNSRSSSASTSRSPLHSRYYNRSRSPVRQQPKPPTTIDQSKFHNLLSCATSPDDPNFLSALELLVTSPNPRELAKMKMSYAHNWTSLHIAALSNAPLYLMYALLLVYPEGAKETDSSGRLPLHLAAGGETSATVLNTLVRFFNESICLEDKKGLIPLHLALSRDGNDEIPVDVIRILLGQSICETNHDGIYLKGGNRKIRDGYMRNKEHLNLHLDEIQDGALGANRNATMVKERQNREAMLRRLNRVKHGGSVSRGFTTRGSEENDSVAMHEHLEALWQDETQPVVGDRYGSMELSEANNFIPEVQHCLKQLSIWKKKYDRETDESSKPEKDIGEYAFINPASIPSSPYFRLPIHMAIRRNYHKKNDLKMSQQKRGRLELPPNNNDILRILIHAYPQSLITCDSQSQTPLMTCLQLIHHVPIQPVDLETIELLLGVRTPGFINAPQWLEDKEFFEKHQSAIDFNTKSGSLSSTSGIANNAAMIPCDEVLPLHVAAHESLSMPILNAIYNCYKGAKYSQDGRKNTPLHCALENITGRNMINFDMIYLLMDEYVLNIQNSMNQSIFDLLVMNAKNGRISSHFDRHTRDKLNQTRGVTLLKQVFHHAAQTESRPNTILVDFYSFPSWLKKQACSTPAVQHLLIRELSTPFNTALVLLNGLVLLSLTITFVSMIDTALAQTSQDTPNALYSHRVGVYITNAYIIFYSLCYAVMAFRLNIGIKDLLRSICTYVTALSVSLSLVVTYRLDVQGEELDLMGMDNQLQVISTVTIGLLWTSIICYLSRWWYGISSFCSSIVNMAKYLLPTLIVLSFFALSFMQMIYMAHIQNKGTDQCMAATSNGSDDAIQICSIWDSFKLVYLLIIGEGFIGAEASSGNAVIVLLLVFVVFAFILILHSISMYILHLQRIGTESAIVNSFWSPLLSFVMVTKSWRSVFCCDKGSERGHNDENQQRSQIQSSCCSSFQGRLADMWDYITIFAYSEVDIKDTKWWYLQRDLGPSHLFGKKWFVRTVGTIILPLWLCLGIMTLGVLWPPQVRLWIYRIRIEDDSCMDSKPLDNVGSNNAAVKAMLYERFHSIEHELHGIKFAINQKYQ